MAASLELEDLDEKNMEHQGDQINKFSDNKWSDLLLDVCSQKDALLSKPEVIRMLKE